MPLPCRQVTLTDLRISFAGTGLRLRFSAGAAPGNDPFALYPNVPAVTSSPFEVRVGDVSTLAVRVPPDGCVLGQACVQAAVVELVDAGGNSVSATSAAATSPWAVTLFPEGSNSAWLYFNSDTTGARITTNNGAMLAPVDGVAQVHPATC